MKNLKEIYFPENVSQAVSLLGRKNSLLFSGGTLAYKSHSASTETLVDLRRCGLGYIRKKGREIVLGAGTTFDDMARSEICRESLGGVLAETAERCSSQLIRNMATVGGNIARPHSFNLFPPLFFALGARVRVLGRQWKKILPVEKLYSFPMRKKIGTEALIKEIIIPARPGLKAEYVKFAKTKSSWESYINMAFTAEIKKGFFVSFSAAAGGVSPVPVSFRGVSAWMKGKKTKDIDLNYAVNLFAEEAMKSGKFGEYRKELAAVFFKRFLGECKKEGK